MHSGIENRRDRIQHIVVREFVVTFQLPGNEPLVDLRSATIGTGI